jgi:hypothetical protein
VSIITLGGHVYWTPGNAYEETWDESGPLDEANAQVLTEALDECPDGEVLRIPLGCHAWRHCRDTNRDELTEWIEKAGWVRRGDPEDLRPLLTANPPPVIVDTDSTGEVYVLENAVEHPIGRLLSCLADYPVLDEERYDNIKREREQDDWSHYGCAETVSQVRGLGDVLDSIPHGNDLFTEWYFERCRDQGYPHWDSKNPLFPSIGKGYDTLDCEEELWAWLTELLWAFVGGQTEENEIALTLLMMHSSCTPIEVLSAAVNDGYQAVLRRTRVPPPDGRKGRGHWHKNAAPFPEVYYAARYLLQTGELDL